MSEHLMVFVHCSGEVYMELLRGVTATVEERRRIWVHSGTLHGSRKDSFGWLIKVSVIYF